MPVTALFLDLGGVLLTNGWDRDSRELAAQTFQLDQKEMDERHHLTFDTYEAGKITLDQYLSRVVFYKQREFHCAAVSRLHLRAVQAVSRDDRSRPRSQGGAQTQNCRRQ